jgi:hypothetical protein
MTVKFINVGLDEQTSEAEVSNSIKEQISKMEFLGDKIEDDESLVVEVSPKENETGRDASLFASEGLHVSMVRKGRKYVGAIPTAHKIGEYFDALSSHDGVVAPYYSIPRNACVVFYETCKLRTAEPWTTEEQLPLWKKFSAVCKYRDWKGGCMLHKKCSYAECRFADV